MKIVFLGTGEAFDENFLNSSILISSEKANLLLDCGGTAPFQLWKINKNQNLLDAVFISHSHADHYFGLPALFTRMWEEKRVKPLSIICLKEDAKKIKTLIKLGYGNIFKRFGFGVRFIRIDLDEEIDFNDLRLSFEETEHSIRNSAIRVESGGKSVCYSGDGMFNKETEALYKNSDLLIQEAYLHDKQALGHGNIMEAVKMAEKRDIKCLALIHINRNLRKSGLSIPQSRIKIVIPNPFDEINL